MKKSRIEQLTQEPMELSKRLEPIMTELSGITQDPDLVEARRHLRGVEQSIHSLESADVPVPEELRLRRRHLEQVLSDFGHAQQALKTIMKRQPVIQKNRRRTSHMSKSTVAHKIPGTCSIGDLISAGLLKDGMTIVHRNKRTGEIFEGCIREPGSIGIIINGRMEYFDSPSTAGTKVSGTSTNGWIYWFVSSNDGSKIVLDEYRQQFLRNK
jgi:hypothetical protein